MWLSLGGTEMRGSRRRTGLSKSRWLTLFYSSFFPLCLFFLLKIKVANSLLPFVFLLLFPSPSWLLCLWILGYEGEQAQNRDKTCKNVELNEVAVIVGVSWGAEIPLRRQFSAHFHSFPLSLEQKVPRTPVPQDCSKQSTTKE